VLKNMEMLLCLAAKQEKRTISIAAAQDEDVLTAAKLAKDKGLANLILVGEKARIVPLAKKAGLEDCRVVDAANEKDALEKAVRLVTDKEAQVLMKGLVNTSDFLKAVLNSRLRTNRLLSHLTANEIPGTEKLVYHTDTGMNVAPDVNAKEQILLNAVDALKSLGVRMPKVAVLAANEKVSEKIPATADAAELVRRAARGDYPPMILEGPIAMDVALNPKAARHKSIDSKISGDVDLFLVPGIEAGNILGKALQFYVRMKVAGVIIGAACPIILTSRAESPEGKLQSIALACCIK
jgi:phosphate butyryltransferase